ncbi:uncharacterized protein LOC116852221 [Odontomachus brunneus]|uniref:uncharacterized protein LOC116852221 n=1 Tax=Odontomachus brunneus TaxID=486640 RepID=UPI0013F1AB5D|nr:uncharacterized protein LOC116852221 [Odontomachus brunneus]
MITKQHNLYYGMNSGHRASSFVPPDSPFGRPAGRRNPRTPWDGGTSPTPPPLPLSLTFSEGPGGSTQLRRKTIPLDRGSVRSSDVSRIKATRYVVERKNLEVITIPAAEISRSRKD